MSDPSRPPLFDFFDVVRVVDTDGEVAEIDRAYGIILGMAQTDSGLWTYAVDVYSDEKLTDRLDGYSVDETHLTATGRSVPSEFVYPGDSIRVSKDGEPL